MTSTVVDLILQDRKIAYAITDCDLKVVEVGGVVSLLGPEGESWLGHSLVAVVPELIGSEPILADILAGKLPRFELVLVNRETTGNEILYITLVELPYRNQQNQITGLLHLVDDVTDMGRFEQQLTQHRNELHLMKDKLARQNRELAAANAELKQLDEMKSKFVSVAAHELRTPLTSIMGYVEVLLDGEVGLLTDEQHQYLEIVDRSTHRLLSTTNNLLDLTHIEAGRIELMLEPNDLWYLIKMAVQEFSPQTEAKEQQLTLSVSPELPWTLCDEMRTIQIITNLLSNASKYTPSGGMITVQLTAADEMGFLKLSVTDNGIGIAAEDQAKLFSRFFRAQSSYQIKAKGAGLGLHITRSLVELHGGRIWFESELGRGSTFYVLFPISY